MSDTSNSRYAILDIIRVIAMAMVVWYHIAITYSYPSRGGIVIPDLYFINVGNIGVTIFLILSGLVLEITYGKKKLPWKTFYIKRALKIFTIYWVCVVFALLLRGYKNHAYFHTTTFDCPECTVLNVTCTIGGFCSQIGLWGGPFMRTGWFIGLILVLYMFFPWFSKMFKSRPNIFLFLLFVVSISSRLTVKSFHFWPYDPLEWFPINRLFEFGLGIYLAIKLKTKQLQILNIHPLLTEFLAFLSDLTFPLFLLHYELDFFIILMNRRAYSDKKAIFFYILMVVLFSYLAHRVSQIALRFSMGKLEQWNKKR